MKYNVELHKISFVKLEAKDFQNLVKKVKKEYSDYVFYGCKVIEK